MIVLREDEQIRRVRIRPLCLLELFEQDAVYKFTVNLGIPESASLVKSYSPYYSDGHIELLVKGHFVDGGKDGYPFDILITQDTNVL